MRSLLLAATMAFVVVVFGQSVPQLPTITVEWPTALNTRLINPTQRQAMARYHVLNLKSAKVSCPGRFVDFNLPSPSTNLVPSIQVEWPTALNTYLVTNKATTNKTTGVVSKRVDRRAGDGVHIQNVSGQVSCPGAIVDFNLPPPPPVSAGTSNSFSSGFWRVHLRRPSEKNRVPSP